MREKQDMQEEIREEAKASFTQNSNEPRFIHMLEGSSWIWKTQCPTITARTMVAFNRPALRTQEAALGRTSS